MDRFEPSTVDPEEGLISSYLRVSEEYGRALEAMRVQLGNGVMGGLTGTLEQDLQDSIASAGLITERLREAGFIPPEAWDLYRTRETIKVFADLAALYKRFFEGFVQLATDTALPIGGIISDIKTGSDGSSLELSDRMDLMMSWMDENDFTKQEIATAFRRSESTVSNRLSSHRPHKPEVPPKYICQDLIASLRGLGEPGWTVTAHPSIDSVVVLDVRGGGKFWIVGILEPSTNLGRRRSAWTVFNVFRNIIGNDISIDLDMMGTFEETVRGSQNIDVDMVLAMQDKDQSWKFFDRDVFEPVLEVTQNSQNRRNDASVSRIFGEIMGMPPVAVGEIVRAR